MQDTSRRGFIVRLKPNEAAIVFMLGEPYRLVTQPGIHFIVPVFDLARIFPVYLANLQDPRSWAATLKSHLGPELSAREIERLMRSNPRTLPTSRASSRVATAESGGLKNTSKFACPDCGKVLGNEVGLRWHGEGAHGTVHQNMYLGEDRRHLTRVDGSQRGEADFVRTALQVLHDNEGNLPSDEVIRMTSESLGLNTYGGFERLLVILSNDAVAAGWLTISTGMWHLTAEGESILELPRPQLMARLRRYSNARSDVRTYAPRGAKAVELLVGLMVFMLGAGMLAWGVYWLPRNSQDIASQRIAFARISAEAMTVQGTVVSSKLSQRCPLSESPCHWYVFVDYAYEIDDSLLIGDQRLLVRETDKPFPFGIAEDNAIRQGVLARYVPGTAVPVHYFPADPKGAWLSPRPFNPKNPLPWQDGLPFVLLGVPILGLGVFLTWKVIGRPVLRFLSI